jgi:hypothetical protein
VLDARMTFYFNRETGKRVSKATWARSKAHGGTRFVRRSSSASTEKQKKSPGATRRNEGSRAILTGSTPSQNPRTYIEYETYYRSLSKRKRRQIEDQEDFEGPEYETGVDY